MPTAKENYQRFQSQKQRIEYLLERAGSIFTDLDMPAEEAIVARLKKKVENESFKVMVLGRFNAGKSTFINALLGADILPAYPIPCTAVINEVRYAETKSARLFFRDPMPPPEKIPPEISKKALQYIGQHPGKTPPPMDIAVEELEDFVVIPSSDKDQSESLAETPYEKVELYWPLPLCKDGVEIGDSPGLDESSIRSRIAFNYLSIADAVLFVMSCEGLCSANEMSYIDDHIRSKGHEYIFFVNNRINQIPEKQRKVVMDFGNARLTAKTAFGQKGIFYINALGALEGRLENDAARIESSGIAPLEDLLADFLANKRGKIKILQPTKELITTIRKGLFEQIPFQRNLLGVKYEDIRRRYEEAKPRLEILETKRKHIVEAASIQIEKALLETRDVIDAYHLQVRQSIPSWIEAAPVTREFDALHPKKSSGPIIEEILDHVRTCMEKEQQKWVDTTLAPFIETKTNKIFGESAEGIRTFLVNLDEVKGNLSGLDPTRDGVDDKSQAERIGAAVLSIFAGGIGSSVVGYQLGFSKELFKQLAIQVGAFFVLMMVGLFNPFTVIPVIIASVVYALIKGKEGLVKELKKRLINKLGEGLDKNNKATTDKMIENIHEKLSEQNVKIDTALDAELQSVKIQVQQIMKEKETEGESSGRRKTLLDSSEAGLRQIDQDLNDLILSIAEQD